MPLTIQNPSETPPGGWVYRDPNTEFVIKHNNLESLFNLATRHRSANGMELPQQEFINVVCASSGGCPDTDSGGPSLVAMATNLIKDISAWAGAGFPKGSAEMIEARRLICIACPHCGGERGGPLIRMSCKLCGCRGVKLKLPTSTCPDNPPRWGPVASPQ